VRAWVAVLCFASLLAAAVAMAAELQVPLDVAGRVQRIDAALARRLRMFSDRPNFQDARLFQLEDSSFVLEITSLADAKLTTGLSRDRIPLTAAGADSLRSAVTAALAERRTEPSLDSSGRPLFVTTTTAMCFGFYGWAVPYLFMENASSEAVTGTYLLISSGGTFVPLWLTRDRSVGMGAALMSWYGMSRGAVHGAVLPYALNEEPGEKTPVGSALAFSIVEGIAGFEWAARTGMTEGTASTINNMGDVGTLYGLGFAALADANGQAASTAALTGAGVGILTGALYARGRDHSYGDASVMRTAGWVGGYLGLAVIGSADPNFDQEKGGIAATMIASAAGLMVGDGLVRKTDFSFGQGVIVDFCTLGGWLFGLGTGYVLSSGGLEESAYWAATGVGTLAGYAIGYGVSAKSARRAAADRSSWRFDIAPSPPARSGQLPGVTVTLATTLR
jgi:hypothetical protein